MVNYTQRNILQKNILKDTSFFLSSTLLILIVFTLNSCEKDKHETPTILIENTTEVFISKDKSIQTNKQKVIEEETVEEKNITMLSQENATTHTKNISNDFTLKDEQHTYQVTLLNRSLTFSGTQKPIIIINLFKSNCAACLSQINVFKKLEKKYSKELFVLNLFDNAQDKEIINFAYAIQNNLDITLGTKPLSVIYTNGVYYNHFEGLAPIEMINHDIQQAIKK